MFDNHFEVFLADTAKGREIHYSIRYQVYCEEMGFENQEDFPEQLEFDDDDARSTHFIVRNKITKQWVGAMRLIDRGNGVLPIEQSCQVDGEINKNPFETVEMSRLCLIKDVRRGKDLDPPHGVMDDSSNNLKETDKLKVMPSQNKINRLIFWGLVYAASEYCYNNNVQFCYFLTTSILAKVMIRGGMDLISVGEAIQHKGERYPYKIDTIKTFQSEIWANGFNNSYGLYSDLDNMKYLAVA